MSPNTLCFLGLWSKFFSSGTVYNIFYFEIALQQSMTYITWVSLLIQYMSFLSPDRWALLNFIGEDLPYNIPLIFAVSVHPKAEGIASFTSHYVSIYLFSQVFCWERWEEGDKDGFLKD